MGNISIGASSTYETINNRFLSVNDTNCINWASSSSSNNSVIINNSTVGDIDIIASGTTDMTCAVNQGLQASLANQISSIAKQQSKQSTDIFNDFTFNGFIGVSSQIQTMYNNITNVSSTTCGSTSQSIANNNYVTVNNSSAGNVYISSDANATSTCTLNNIVVMEAINTLLATTDNTSTNRGMFVAIAYVIAMVIVAIIVVIVIAVVIIAIAKSSQKNKQESKPITEDQAIAAEIASLK